MTTQTGTYNVITPNAELAVTLERARQHLRNEDLHYDDDYMRGIIRAAVDVLERTYGLALLTQTVRQWHASFPCDSAKPMMLRIAPLISVTSIQYIDSAGATQTWSASEYTTGHYNGRPIIVPKTTYTWPTDTDPDHPNAVIITYQAGYGDKPSNVPPVITQSLLLSITDFYENRTDSVRNLPTTVDRLMQGFYRFSC